MAVEKPQQPKRTECAERACATPRCGTYAGRAMSLQSDGHTSASSLKPQALSRAVWLSDELVAQAVNGEDVLGRLRVGFEFLPQAGDVHVHRPRQRHLVVAPHVGQQR